MSSMGMDKSGTQSIATGTWVKLLTFTVRSGYPSTVITSSALVMDASAVGNFEWRGSFTGTAGTQQFRIVRNGTTVIGAAVNQSVTGTATGVSVSNGDTIELQAFTQFSGGFATVNAGTGTYVKFDQTSSNFTISGDQSISWAATASLAVSSPVDSGAVLNWLRTGGLSLGGQVDAAETISWDRTANLYVGVRYDIDGDQTISWDRSADLLWTPLGAAPPALGDIPETTISIHTADGRAVGVLPSRSLVSVKWGREANEVSIGEFVVSTEAEAELLEELRYWAHWATVWENDIPVWTGPILKIVIGRENTTITCRDPAIFMWRTRIPITKTWVDTSPARVASVLWGLMYQLQGIHVTPTVIPGAVDERFTLAAKADTRYLHQLMNDLVKVGLSWTVVAGRPVLGKFPTDPIAELAECDFMAEVQRIRDGSDTYNDVRVQGQNWAATAVVPLAGLHLQRLVSLDDLFGASNIARATQQYAAESARFHDVLEIPAGATLHPDAPVTLDDLVPGKVIAVHAANIIQPMRVDQMSVTTTESAREVTVSLVAIPQLGEIATLTEGAPS